MKIPHTDKPTLAPMLDLMKIMTGPRMRTMCPVCKGGHTHEKSLTLYRTATYLSWSCYRASCEVGKGYSYLPVPDRNYVPAVHTAPPEDRQFTGDLLPITNEMQLELFNRWQLPPKACRLEGFKTAPTQDRLYMPVLNIKGEETGAVLRCLRKPARQPKTVNYFTFDAPLLHFPTTLRYGSKDNTLVLVEDILSALKASLCGVWAASLLGCSLNEREAMYLRKMGVRHLVVALDQDTWFKDMANAIRIKKTWGLYFDTIELKYLTKDLKDIPIEEIKTIFGV